MQLISHLILQILSGTCICKKRFIIAQSNGIIKQIIMGNTDHIEFNIRSSTV